MKKISRALKTEVWVMMHENEGVVFKLARNEEQALKMARRYAVDGLDRRTQIAKFVIDEATLMQFGGITEEEDES